MRGMVLRQNLRISFLKFAHFVLPIIHGDSRPLKENIHNLSMLYIKELKDNNLTLFL